MDLLCIVNMPMKVSFRMLMAWDVEPLICNNKYIFNNGAKRGVHMMGVSARFLLTLFGVFASLSQMHNTTGI